MGRLLTLVRNTVVNIIFIFILIVAALSLLPTSDLQLEDNTILRLNLGGEIVEERRPSSPLDSIYEESFGMESQTRYLILSDILSVIETAADDPSITAIQLNLEGLGYAGLNQLNSIGKALNSFKQRGKKVISAEEFYTQQQYYLASFADEIILDPMGVVALKGLSSNKLYFKDFFEKVKVNYHVFRVGSHKSAVEPILRNSMSEEVRTQDLALINETWKNYREDIAAQRGLAPSDITDYVENILNNLRAVNGDTAQLALQEGLVDRLFTQAELKDYLKSFNGGDSPNFVDFEEYAEHTYEQRLPAPPEDNGIGIIIAEGNILPGNQPAGVIGSESLTRLIRDARDDSSIKAVVIRLNSPGGSALASEHIRQEILGLKKTGKPVVISMGNVAASGGYWISADADQIWASPFTLTGSIGIFAAIPTFERLLSELGIHSDGVETNSISEGINLTRPIHPDIAESMELVLRHNYNKFLSIVHDGRKIADDQLDDIAQGKVYNGEQALKLNLIDNIGSLDDAVQAAANLAGIEDYVTVPVERESSVRDRILAQLVSTTYSLFPELTQSSQFKALIRLVNKEISQMTLFNDPNHIYAHAMINLPL